VKRAVLVIADAGDELARLVCAQVPGSVLCHEPTDARFSFAADAAGRVSSGIFELGDRRVDWSEIGGIVFRPGRAWPSPARARSIPKAFAAHEWCAAWSAMLAAFPGSVVDPLPPGWFLDRRRHNEAQACRLAACLGARWTAGRGSDESALIVGDEVLAVDVGPGPDRFPTWLRGHLAGLQVWRRNSAVRCARITGRRDRAGWAICGVDQVPSADGMRRGLLAHWARSMVALVSA
jgi:hypothetical protein